MIPSHRLNPTTKKFDERPFSRTQRNFQLGMSYDLPDGAIASPSNSRGKMGVREIVDYINMGTYLKGRGGSQLWSSTAFPVIDTCGIYTHNWTISGTVRTITASSGTPYTAAMLGRWAFLGSINLHERIIQVVSSRVIKTRTSQAASTGSTTMTTHGQPWGAIFHEGIGIGVIHIGTSFYSFDYTMATYTQIVICSNDGPQECRTYFSIYKNKIVAINGGNIFLINTDYATISAWKANTQCPTSKVAVDTVDLEIGRAHV
jgi:hypothetical protein